jgi:hypothetical protein
MEMSGQVHALVALPPRKELPVPIGYGAGCGHCGEAKNLRPMLGIEPHFLGRPARSLVTILCYLGY